MLIRGRCCIGSWMDSFGVIGYNIKMQCELCGREGEIVSAIIEGVELNACLNCAKHGQILKKPVLIKKEKKIQAEEIEESLVSNFAALIKRKREQLGLNQEDFAKMLNEKLSVLHNIENGSFRPSIAVARKFERILGIKIIEEIRPQKISLEKIKAGGLTIGDILNKK